MAKRRTAGIQRRPRATEAALRTRLGAPADRRLWLAAGGLAIAVVAVVGLVVLSLTQGPPPGAIQPDGGAGHISDGASGGPYTSTPATSGKHWQSPAQWGVYRTPVAESQVLHNLEHSGIVIWYEPNLDSARLQQLTAYVQRQLGGAQFKFILSPWSGNDFGHPIAVSAWRYLLYLDSVDTSQIDAFVGAHYGRGPEPNGGPGPPGA